jgi:hypothetical protein
MSKVKKVFLQLMNIGIGKYKLPNILNWLGFKVIILSRELAGYFISWAIFLNPEKTIFKKNLILLGLKNNITDTKLKAKDFPLINTIKGCKSFSKNIKFFQVDSSYQLYLPKIINRDIKLSDEYICNVKLPDTYCAGLENVTIFGGTDLIIVNDTALYDEIERDVESKIYPSRSPIITKATKSCVNIRLPTAYTEVIDCGIHFTKDHSSNYFHWLIDCLPRLGLIKDLDNSIPLLIDEQLPSQALEALKVMNVENRPIITLKYLNKYLVKKLYYPSSLSVMHDRYDKPNYSEDIIYSPKAINFVRNSILSQFDIKEGRKTKKIYISRSRGGFRAIHNSDEIENLLITQGFEIICPDRLTFFTQIQIFSQAKVIIGQAGAAMANIIFVPKNCKVLIMTSDIPEINLHCFNPLGEILELNLEFLIGKHESEAPLAVHSDFYVDTKLLLNYLKDID